MLRVKTVTEAWHEFCAKYNIKILLENSKNPAPSYEIRTQSNRLFVISNDAGLSIYSIDPEGNIVGTEYTTLTKFNSATRIWAKALSPYNMLEIDLINYFELNGIFDIYE